MSSGGGNRDWGYASYDVDRCDDISDSNLGYTSYEKSGSVNKYFDNGDGGHSHEHWRSSDDYNSGNDADYSRSSSNSSGNPSIGEVENSGGCYLTSACMRYMKENFDDNCYELTVLRWFRDNFVSTEDIQHYYKVAPIIVNKIDSLKENGHIYNWIYENIVSACVKAIDEKDYKFAYDRYKNSVLALEDQFLEETLTNQNVVNKVKARTI